MEPTPITGAPTIHPNNVNKNAKTPEYTTPEKKYISFKRNRLIAARDARDCNREEWDDMTFLKYYDILKKADDQYVAPRKNRQDTSINTGTIRDKDTTLVEYANKFDFEPVAQCYDEDDEMMQEIAETGEDMVRKSLMLEDFHKAKAKRIYRSMVAFGTALVEDQWIERWEIVKQIGKGVKIGSLSMTWTDEKRKMYDGCNAKLWDLRKCYFGDIRKFFMNGPEGQPYFFTVEYESYDITKQMFGDWERWINVPDTVVMTPEVSGNQQWSPWWTLRPISSNYCEIVRYYDPIMNEFGISINGVEMLPLMSKKNPKYIDGQGEEYTVSGFPLTEVSPSGVIPFAKYDLEPLHDIVYSKAQPGKMRVWADVENMVVKLFIRGFKQRTDPTMGNKSGRNFGPEVTDPATVINDVRDGDLFPILPNYQGGGSAQDMSFYGIVKRELAKNSVQDSFQGIDGSDADPKKKTATQDMNDRGAQALDVASLFDGITYGNSQLYWLRTFNIAKNWTKPIDIEIDTFKKTIENKYRSVSVPTEVDGGQKAVKKIIFTKNMPSRPKGRSTLEDSQAVHQEELNYEKQGHGKQLITYLHPEEYRSMKLAWSYVSIPVPNASDPLSYMLFAKQINDAITFFGPQSLNAKKLKHRFAKLTGQDYDTWFLAQQELDQQQQQAAQMEAAQGAPGNVPGKPVAGKPTIAGAAGGSIPGNGMAALMK